MHPIEARLIEIVKSGRSWKLEELGGISEVARAARELGTTPMMPELLRPIVLGWNRATAVDRDAHRRALLDLLEVATTDFVLLEAVDILDHLRPLPDDGDECCFMRLLAKAASSGSSLSGLSRGAALDGAFRWAGDNRRWQLRMLDFLLGLVTSDDPEFLRHAAKIAGVAFSHWRDKELVGVLGKLAQLESVRPEAAFELGMASLAEAMDTASIDTATNAFREAREWFGESDGLFEHRPEAALYVDGLDLLLSFHSGAASASLGAVSARVQQHAFELHAWAGDSGPVWLGARQTQAACWNALAGAVAGLAASLDEPSWWQPAAVIEDNLLSVYSAGRSILRRSQHGGIEVMVRPRIRESLTSQAGQAHQIRIWLQQHATHEWASEARELIAQVDAFVGKPGSLRIPREAAWNGTSLAAIIAGSTIPKEQRTTLLGVIANAVNLQTENLTGAEVDIIERCCNEARSHPDYSTNASGERLFDVVLLWLVRFVFNRLELTRRDDPAGAYLFEREDGSLPHEDELQEDFFRWLTMNAAGTDLEPTNIASGRADIRLRSGPERLVVEVKRETGDCSFDALSKSYGAQTTDYQNVSVRLGVLLVLDLATPNREGTPHLSSLFAMRRIKRTNEAEARLVLMVKVPGRRRIPSDLTKLAKKTRQKPRSGARQASSERPKPLAMFVHSKSSKVTV